MNDYERDPYKVMFLVICCLFSLYALVRFNAAAGTTLRSFPKPFGYIFLVVLGSSSGLSLFGIIRNRTVHGILLERAGQIGVGVLFLTYGAWAYSLFGETATGFASDRKSVV